MKTPIKHQKGLVRTIILIAVALLIISYLGLNLREIVNSPTFQDNWVTVKDGAIWLWENILKVPVLFIWNDLFVPTLKKLFEQGTPSV